MVSRYIKIILFISAILLCRTMKAGEFDSRIKIISRGELQLYGVVKLTDIVNVIDEWNFSSIDGYRIYSDGGGTNTFDNQDWIVFIDGVKTEIKFIEFNHLNMIPISIDDVEYIEIVEEPGIYWGCYVKRGAVNFVTRKEIEKLSFNGMVSTGNQIGDPGPFRYTDPDTKNVDQLGPDYSLRLGFGKDFFSGNISAKYHIHTSTDPLMEIRNDQLSWIYRQTRQFSYFGKVNFDFDTHSYELFGGRSQSGDPGLFNELGADLMYINVLGREIHAMNDAVLGGFSSEISLSSKVKLNFHASIANKRLYPMPETLIKADMQKDDFFTGFSCNYSNQSFAFAVGYNYHRRKLYNEMGKI